MTFGGATPSSQHGMPSLANSTSQVPALRSLGLATNQDSSAERGITRPDGLAVDVADKLVDAMTKMMNNRRRRSSQSIGEVIDHEIDAAQLSQLQRQILQKVILSDSIL